MGWMELVSVKRSKPSRFVLGVALVVPVLCECANDKTASDTSGGGLITGISAAVSDNVATVVTVEWHTASPTTCRVEFGEGESFSYATPMEAEAGETHRAVLLGMPSRTDVRFRIVAVDGETEVVSDSQTITTESLPTYLPEVTVDGTGPDGFTLVPIIGTTAVAVTVIDPRGRIVWYHEDDSGLDVYRARLSRDKQHIIYNAASVSGAPDENSEIVRVSLDGSETVGTPVALLAHDFVEMADGTIGAIAAEYRTVNDEEIMGNRIVEVSENGTVTPVWSTWDCFDPETDRDPTLGDAGNGWTFANALDYDPEEDVYYIGFLNLSSIAKVDRQSGECLWVFGSTAATISFADGSPHFLRQHQFEVFENGILVFDNDGALDDSVSRVTEYEFDFETHTASSVWTYIADPAVFTFVLGEPIRLEDGNTLINWSASGQMNLVTPDGDSIYQINLPIGYVFAFNTVEPSFY